MSDETVAYSKSFLEKNIHLLTSKIAHTLINITWITPNTISWLSGIVGGLGVGYFILQNAPITAVIFIALSGILDCLDGDLARARGVTSKEGDILDSVLDRYVDFIILGALILAAPETNLIPGLLALLGTTMVPYVRAKTEAQGKTSVASIGDRTTRTLLLILGLLTGQIFPILIVLAIITNIAAIHRFIYALGT